MNVKALAQKSKNVVVRHRGKIVFVTTVVVMHKIGAIADKQMTDFITQKGLMEEYMNTPV